MQASEVAYLFGLDGKPIRAVGDVSEWTVDERIDSTNRLIVDTSLAEARDIVSDMELVFNGRRYVVTQVDRARGDGIAELTADECQSEMANIELETFKCENLRFRDAVGKVLAPTLWTVGTIETDRRVYADLQGKKVTELLQWLANLADLRLAFDSYNRVVDFLRPLPSEPSRVFTYGDNLDDIKKTETPPTCTVLHPIGANGLTVRGVNNDSELVEDFGWYVSLGLSETEARKRYTKRQEWQDERYTVAANLLADARKKLAVTAYPTISYDLTAVDDIQGLRLGEIVAVWDEPLQAKVVTKVSVIHHSSGHDDDSVTLDYVPPSFTIATDTLSGDTDNTEQESVFQAFTMDDFALGRTAQRVLPVQLDVYADTWLEVYACINVKTTTAGELDGYWLLNGERAGARIQQACEVGWVTIGLPFLITNVSANDSLTLDLYLSHSGAGSIAKNDGQVFIRARGAYGGVSNERPDTRVVDAVSRFMGPLRTVSDLATVSFPELSELAVADSVSRFMDSMRTVSDTLQPFVWLADDKHTITLSNAEDGAVFTLANDDASWTVGMPPVTGGSTSLDVSTVQGVPTGTYRLTIVELGVVVTVTI